MKITDAFPSKYLRASDFEHASLLTMAHVVMEDLDDGEKPALYFLGHAKPLLLNKTNANVIKDAYGDDTDNWQGKQIVLYSEMVSFQGKTSPAIRVRRPKPTAPAAAPKPVEPDPLDDGARFDNDPPF